MEVILTEAQRRQLRALQKQRRDQDGYVKVTVVLLLDKGRSPGSIAEDLGLDQATVYRYAAALAALGVDNYLQHEQPGYWGRLSSAQLAHLCREVNTTLYTRGQELQAWLEQTYQVHYSVSGLTELLHRLGFTYKLTTPGPCQADAAAQQAFLTHLAVLEAEAEAGQVVLYYADAAHPTHNTRCTRAWCQVGEERPLPRTDELERGLECLHADPGAAGRNQPGQCAEYPSALRAALDCSLQSPAYLCNPSCEVG